MNDSDTPETDAEEVNHGGDTYHHDYIRADFARNLERQRNELRMAIRILRDAKGRHNTQIATERLFKLIQ